MTTEPNTPLPRRVGVCGTRAIWRMPDETYRVACATCDTSGRTIFSESCDAWEVAIDSSNRPCGKCGAQ